MVCCRQATRSCRYSPLLGCLRSNLLSHFVAPAGVPLTRCECGSSHYELPPAGTTTRWHSVNTRTQRALRTSITHQLQASQSHLTPRFKRDSNFSRFAHVLSRFGGNRYTTTLHRRSSSWGSGCETNSCSIGRIGTRARCYRHCS